MLLDTFGIENADLFARMESSGAHRVQLPSLGRKTSGSSPSTSHPWGANGSSTSKPGSEATEILMTSFRALSDDHTVAELVPRLDNPSRLPINDLPLYSRAVLGSSDL